MGYRTYIGKINKSYYEKIHACKTHKEYKDAVLEHLRPLVEEEKKNNIEPKWKTAQQICNGIMSDDDEDCYIPDVVEELYEFGKDFPAYNDIYNENSVYFLSDDLKEQNEYYDAVVINKEIFKKIILWYREKIITHYKTILDDNYKDEYFLNRTQFDALKQSAEDNLFYWERFGGVDLEDDHETIVHSWLYEHAIFELTRIYKSFDWENDMMVFYGY